MRVSVCCFTAQSVNKIGWKLINNCSKICLKFTKIRLGRALEGGLGAQLAAERGQRLEEDENHGSWTPLTLFLGSHLRAQHDPGVFQKGF